MFAGQYSSRRDFTKALPLPTFGATAKLATHSGVHALIVSAEGTPVQIQWQPVCCRGGPGPDTIS